MSSDHIIFAGVQIGSGRKPVTLAALDDVLNVTLLEKCDFPQALVQLKPYDSMILALNTPSGIRGRKNSSMFKKGIVRVGFKAFSRRSAPRQWVETRTQMFFQAVIGKNPLPRRTLEGRVQRTLILFDQGLQIKDPMDFFEEITRHHMLMGEFPNELLYSASELDALCAAYIAWLAVNDAEQVKLVDDVLLFEGIQPGRE
jgi:hypothetical protein